MKHILMPLLLAALLLVVGQAAQAAEPSAACPQRGLCGYLSDYLCCRQGYCAKPAPCPPCYDYATCCVPYCKKPAPCPPNFCLKFCPDCYCPKPLPVCFPKPPCK